MERGVRRVEREWKESGKKAKGTNFLVFGEKSQFFILKREYTRITKRIVIKKYKTVNIRNC